MGQRANLIIVKNGTYDLYYSHWCANVLPEELFWGVEHALQFIRIQTKADKETGWLDEVWAEGGAVIDLDKKVFLLYGGEDIAQDIPLRRMYLQLLAQVWHGWEIKWAYEGIADLADYVGYPTAKVLKPTEEKSVVLCPPAEKDWLTIIASVRFIDSCTLLFPLDGIMEGGLCYGSRVVDMIDRTFGQKEIILSEWTTTFPQGGFHIDIPEQTLDYWLAAGVPGLLTRLRQKWQGWKVNWHRDCFESHIAQTQGKIVVQNRTWEETAETLRCILLKEIHYDPVDSILKFAGRFSPGQTIQVNSYALSNPTCELENGTREEIFERALQGLIGSR